MNRLYLYALISVAAGNCQPVIRGDLALTNINVVDVVHGRVIEGQDVFITNGVIARITSHASATAETTALVDGTGKFLVPGFWDMHVHFRGGPATVDENKDLLPLYVINGVTSVHEMGGDITDSLVKWREEIENGQITGPHLFLTGPKLDGPNPSFSGSIVIDSPTSIPEAIERLRHWNVDGAKVMGATMTPDNFYRTLEACHDAGLRTFAHTNPPYSILEASRRHLSAVAHMASVYNDASPLYDSILSTRPEQLKNPVTAVLALQAVDFSKVPTLLAALAENKTAVITTYLNTYAIYHADSASELIYPQLNAVGPLLTDMTRQSRESFKRFPPKVKEMIQIQYENMRKGLPYIAASDVVLLVGTDAGPRNPVPGLSYHQEMELLVDNGLSPDYVLRAATINAATFMGRSDVMGTVDEGKLADLIVMTKNPLDNIQNTQTIDGVVLHGKWLSQETLQGMRNELEAKYN